MWQSLWYAVLLLQFIKILFYNSAIIPKLQSCIPIVVSGFCSLASSRSGAANSLHLLLKASPSCNSGDSLHPPLDIVQSLPVEVGDEVPVPLYHVLPSHSLSFLWSWLLSFSHCGKPLLRILIFCFSLCHRCYSPVWQSRSSSIAWLGGGASTELRYHLGISPQLSVHSISLSTIYFCTNCCV